MHPHCVLVFGLFNVRAMLSRLKKKKNQLKYTLFTKNISKLPFSPFTLGSYKIWAVEKLEGFRGIQANVKNCFLESIEMGTAATIIPVTN